MKKRALFLGRFQPVHNGHIDGLRQILDHPENFDEVLIGIGSAENDYLPENPLTAGERFELFTLALEEAGIPREKIWIFPVRNIDHYSLWPKHVARLCPSFQAVFSGSPLVRMLWKEHFSKDIQVFELSKNLNVSATGIREKIRTGESLKDLVPAEVQSALEQWNIRMRLENMNTQ